MSGHEEPSLILKEARTGGKLFLGNRHTAESPERLRQLNITSIVNAAPAHVKGPPEGLAESISYHSCDLQDAPRVREGKVEFDDVGPYVAPAIRFVSEALQEGRNVLVHCAGGISRSATLVLAFLMLYDPAKYGAKSSWSDICGLTFCSNGGKEEVEKTGEEGNDAEERPPMTLANAMRLVQARRPIIAPNAGFMRQLLAIETEVWGATTVKDPMSDHQRAFIIKEGC